MEVFMSSDTHAEAACVSQSNGCSIRVTLSLGIFPGGNEIY
jgi:hypothetical protein